MCARELSWVTKCRAAVGPTGSNGLDADQFVLQVERNCETGISRRHMFIRLDQTASAFPVLDKVRRQSLNGKVTHPPPASGLVNLVLNHFGRRRENAKP
jgi:hypothetical protein